MQQFREFVTFSDGDNKSEKSFTDEKRLKDGQDIVENFDPVAAKLVRIESRVEKLRGPHMFCLGGFELFSPDTAHTSGVFRSLFSQNRARVCDFFNARARDYCGFKLHDPNTTMEVFTSGVITTGSKSGSFTVASS